MKKAGKLALLGTLTALALTPFAQAADGERPLSENNTGNNAYFFYRPFYGFYGWRYPYWTSYSYCYWYPNLCYWYLRQSSDNFASEVGNTPDPQTVQAYADEAAHFLQNGGEPSETLRQAMNMEREILLKSGIQDAKNMKDNVLASLVAARAAQPNDSENQGSN